jgi:hypothetical protein
MDATLQAEEIRGLLARAQAGDASVLPQLKQFLDERPEVWRRLGDLAVHARDALLALAAADSLLARESMARRMDELEAELAGTSPSPLERVLAHRAALTWAQAHLADLDALQNDTGATPLAAHALRRQESAARRFAQAVRSLATVRRLLPSVAGQAPCLRAVSQGG